MTIKQVIVVRKDLNMRRGKEEAQTGHATIAFILKRLSGRSFQPNGVQMFGTFSDVEVAWMDSMQTKITLQVSSEAELFSIYEKAKQANLTVHLIQDEGKTEFKEPTYTCLAIGPHIIQHIDPITGHLEPR